MTFYDSASVTVSVFLFFFPFLSWFVFVFKNIQTDGKTNSPKYLNITRKKSPILSSPYPAPRLTWFLQPKHPKGQGDRLNMASTEGLRASWQSRQGFSAHRWDQYPGCEGRTCRAAPWISSSIDGVQMKRHQTKETWRACLMSTQGVGS